jgi:hypothetical protein
MRDTWGSADRQRPCCIGQWASRTACVLVDAASCCFAVCPAPPPTGQLPPPPRSLSPQLLLFAGCTCRCRVVCCLALPTLPHMHTHQDTPRASQGRAHQRGPDALECEHGGVRGSLRQLPHPHARHLPGRVPRPAPQGGRPAVGVWRHEAEAWWLVMVGGARCAGERSRVCGSGLLCCGGIITAGCMSPDKTCVRLGEGPGEGRG